MIRMKRMRHLVLRGGWVTLGDCVYPVSVNGFLLVPTMHVSGAEALGFVPAAPAIGNDAKDGSDVDGGVAKGAKKVTKTMWRMWHPVLRRAKTVFAGRLWSVDEDGFLLVPASCVDDAKASGFVPSTEAKLEHTKETSAPQGVELGAGFQFPRRVNIDGRWFQVVTTTTPAILAMRHVEKNCPERRIVVSCEPDMPARAAFRNLFIAVIETFAVEKNIKYLANRYNHELTLLQGHHLAELGQVLATLAGELAVLNPGGWRRSESLGGD